jgi:hypothetical protein
MNAGEKNEGDEGEKGIEEGIADENKLYSPSSLKAHALPTSTYCHDLCVCVTIDGILIGECIYLPLIHTTRNNR